MCDVMTTPAIQRILAVLQQSPGLSRRDIAAQAFVASTTLSGGGYLKTLKDAGLIHISGWGRNSRGAFAVPLFSAGNGPDRERPVLCVENRMSPKMVRLLDAIREFGPLDYREAAKVLGISPNAMKGARNFEPLLAQKKIHIVSWRRGRSGPMRPVYAFGPGNDAPRPETSCRELSHRRKHPEVTRGSVWGIVAQLVSTTSRASLEIA